MMMICYCYPFSRKEESAISYQKLDIEKLTNDQCRTMFRFDRDDIKILSHALQTPEIIICENRTTATNIEGLCIVLRRLAYPSRLDDLEPVFGRSKAEISYIFNYVLDFLLGCSLEQSRRDLIGNGGFVWIEMAYKFVYPFLSYSDA